MFVVLIIIMVGLAGSLGVLERGQVQESRPAVQTTRSLADDQAFVAYRDAVLRFAEQNPSFRGTVQPAQLVWPAGVTALASPPGASNSITSGGNGGRIVCAWASVGGSMVGQLVNGLGRDATIGVSNGPDWSTPVYGEMGPLPAAVPTGDIVSVVEIGS